MIWYSNDEDGFLLFNQRLLIFLSAEEANIFADKEHIIFEKGITVFNLSKIIELINNVEISQNCRNLIDAWHLFSDLSKSLNKEFVDKMIKITDEYREVAKEYRKLFGYGVPLSMIHLTVDMPDLLSKIKRCILENKDTLLEMYGIKINDGELF